MTNLDDHITQFGLRTIQQCITESMSRYWLARAETLEAARHRPGDFIGRATPEELADRDAKLTLAATNCRIHAGLLAAGTVDPWQPPTVDGHEGYI